MSVTRIDLMLAPSGSFGTNEQRALCWDMELDIPTPPTPNIVYYNPFVGKLINANNLTLINNVGGLPDVSASVMSFLQPVTVCTVTQQMINGYYEPLTQMIATQASIQPMKQELAIKMEGERNWRWSIIHILPNVDLQNNDFITLFGIKYKVMGRENWFQYGYIMYHVVEYFQTENQ